MNLLCLCPTYGRPPALLETTIELFLRQDYPAENRRLVIFDDLGNCPTIVSGAYAQAADASQTRVDWHVLRRATRAPSLPSKYDELLALEPWGDAVVVWDDDDIYLPWHLRAHAQALGGWRWNADAPSGGAWEIMQWSKPSQIRSTYGCPAPGQTIVESAAGRFHGSLAIRRELLARVGGWRGVMPLGEEKRADFDQRMISALSAVEPLSDPLEDDPRPSYVYGWGRARHCSGLMASPDNQTWYDRHAETAYTAPIEQLTPRLDPHAAAVCAALV